MRAAAPPSLRHAGAPVDEAAILADILRRDERDRSRAVAPLKPAADAHQLDTTQLDVDAVVAAAVAIVELGRALIRSRRTTEPAAAQP